MNLKLIEDSARIVSAFVPSNVKQEIQTLIVRAVEESKLKTDEMSFNLETVANDVNDVKLMLAAIQASLSGNATTVPDAPEEVLEDIQDTVEDIQDIVEEVNDSPDEVIIKVDDNV